MEAALDTDPPSGTAIGPLPITERVLGRLGGSRPVWVVLWSLVPLVSPLIFVPAVRLAGHELDGDALQNLVVTQAVLSYASFVLLWGGRILSARASAVSEDVSRTLAAGRSPALFRGIGSVAGPLTATALVAVIVTADGWVRYGPMPPLAALPLLCLYLLPILSFVWVYLVILSDLNRLGRVPLALDEFPQDRTLGLERLGSLASVGLGILFIATVPLMLAGIDEPVTIGLSLAVVALTVAIFVLSMWRLHGQMARAKVRYVTLARTLYRDAYGPLRDAPTIERLEEQATVLRAAQSLDERAHSLPTWPIDESTTRFIAVVITGVLTSLIVRGLFAALGG